MFEEAKWIRANVPTCANEYNEFYDVFTTINNENIKCCISSETEYALYINGEIAGFGQYHDLTQYKVYDEIDITAYCTSGKNTIAIIGYFENVNTSCYCEKGLGLIFEVVENGKKVCVSGRDTKSRRSNAYVSGDGVSLISGQIGYSYVYDFTKEDNWKTSGGLYFYESMQIEKNVALYPRPIDKLAISDTTNKIISQGEYKDIIADTAAEKMQYAGIFYKTQQTMGITSLCLPSVEGIEITGEENIYLLTDMAAEKSGYLTFDVYVEEECVMLVGYGEHIVDGRARTYINGRCFAFELHLMKGRNKFIGYFRRLGARFLSLMIDTKKIKIYNFGLLEASYPVKLEKPKIDDKLYSKIYDVSVNTLRVCMHEHYEDTPWREQSLYAMDSRNQMLCGYIAFKEYNFARASLKLLSLCLRDDNLFALTSPSSTDVKRLTIPCFSLIQFCSMFEYAKNSGDISLFIEFRASYKKVMDNFIGQICSNGLISNFKGKYIWNFYEWTSGLEGNFLVEATDRYECPLNCFLVLALNSYVELLNLVEDENAIFYSNIAEKLKENIDKYFYDEEKGCYATFLEDFKLTHFCELNNSLAILAINKRNTRTMNVLSLLSKKSFLNEISLSHAVFKFWALLDYGDGGYERAILDCIGDKWGEMLYAGATTFYETEDGEEAFSRAGSLSHGWSAVPIIFLDRILNEKRL